MQKTMCGVVKEKPEPGAVWREDLPIPKPGPRDVLVRVRATAICGTDQHILPWTPYAQARVKPPMVFGHEFAGDIVEVGEQVTEFHPGQRVAGETHIPCNKCYMCKSGRRHNCADMKIIGVHAPGSFAEYIAFPADCVYVLPDGISYEHGSMLEPMGVAVHGVSRANVAGQTVLIYGAGPIGLMAVGAAKAWKAKRIFCADLFDAKLAVAKEVGADTVVNTKKEDIARIIADATDGEGVDIVIDYTGNNQAMKSGFEALKKNGTFVAVGLPSGDTTLDWTDCIIYKEAAVYGVTGRLMYETWDECIEILQSPDFHLEKIIGGVYPLKEYEKAFGEIAAGAPGKFILVP